MCLQACSSSQTHRVVARADIDIKVSMFIQRHFWLWTPLQDSRSHLTVQGLPGKGRYIACCPVIGVHAMITVGGNKIGHHKLTWPLPTSKKHTAAQLGSIGLRSTAEIPSWRVRVHICYLNPFSNCKAELPGVCHCKKDDLIDPRCLDGTCNSGEDYHWLHDCSAQWHTCTAFSADTLDNQVLQVVRIAMDCGWHARRQCAAGSAHDFLISI